MKNFFLLLLTTGLTTACAAQAGVLDSSFSQDGLQNTILSPGNDQIYSLALLPNGDIAAAGRTMKTSNVDFATLFYRPDGSLATQVITDFGKTDDIPCKALLQNDGKIVVAGYSNNKESSIYKFVLARYRNTGLVDSSFGIAGKVTVNFNAYLTDKAFAATLQGDGKIILAGDSESGQGFHFAMARFNPDGSLDADFGTMGFVTTPIKVRSAIRSIALRPDGYILVSGVVHSNSSYTLALARYLPDGSPDPAFGDNGIVSTGLPVKEPDPQTLLLLPDGAILWAGTSGNDFALARFDANGAPDLSLGSGGQLFTTFGAGSADRCAAAIIQPDGKIVCAGSTDSGGNAAYGLMRFNPDGTPDSSFGNAGQIVTPVLGKNDFVNSLALQSDGKLLAAGGSDGGGTGTDFSLARYHTGLAVSLHQPEAALEDLRLFPNPAGQATTLSYRLLRAEKVTIRLWTSDGICLRTIFSEQRRNAGGHSEQLRLGQQLLPGVYRLSIEAGGSVRQIPLVHL